VLHCHFQQYLNQLAPHLLVKVSLETLYRAW